MTSLQTGRFCKKRPSKLADVIFTTMIENQRGERAGSSFPPRIPRFSFWWSAGRTFPLIGELEALLREAVIKATVDSPLRHNSVEGF